MHHSKMCPTVFFLQFGTEPTPGQRAYERMCLLNRGYNFCRVMHMPDVLPPGEASRQRRAWRNPHDPGERNELFPPLHTSVDEVGRPLPVQPVTTDIIRCVRMFVVSPHQWHFASEWLPACATGIFEVGEWLSCRICCIIFCLKCLRRAVRATDSPEKGQCPAPCKASYKSTPSFHLAKTSLCA